MLGKKLQRGVVILTIVFVLLGTISLLVLYMINAGVIGERVISHEYQTQQAFEAASAGLNYGVVYLQQNHDSIVVDSDSNGTIDANSTSQTLSNGSSFTLSFTNPVVNDFTLIEISVTGTSADGNASRQMTQLVKFVSFGEHFEPIPLVSRGDVTVAGTGLIRNLIAPITIWSGNNITFSGSGHTESNDGSGSSASYTHTDVVPNDSNLGGLSDDDFFRNIFGVSKEEIRSQADSYFSSSSTKVYNDDLDGKHGELIWIDQTGGEAQISSDIQIGTPTKPVILIVDGDLKATGTPVIYGFIYVSGDFYLAGDEEIYGGIMVNGSVIVTGSAELIYSDTVFDHVRNSLGVFNIVPGSWKDF